MLKHKLYELGKIKEIIMKSHKKNEKPTFLRSILYFWQCLLANKRYYNENNTKDNKIFINDKCYYFIGSDLIIFIFLNVYLFKYINF